MARTWGLGLFTALLTAGLAGCPSDGGRGDDDDDATADGDADSDGDSDSDSDSDADGDTDADVDVDVDVDADADTDADVDADADGDVDADGDGDVDADGDGDADVECGNGIEEAGEDCDDGNRSNDDTCLNTCERSSCGDGYVQDGVEACDDGNRANDDDCLSTCLAASCGDGYVRQGFEDCDPLAVDVGQCTDQGFQGGTLGCSDDCAVDITDCHYILSSAPGLDLPDSDAAGVIDLIGIPSICEVADVTVDVTLRHTYVGDVLMRLQSPSGTVVTLHNRTGAGGDDIVGNYPNTFPVDGPGTLADYDGEQAYGNWSLLLSDNGVGDSGILESWTLSVTCVGRAVDAVAHAIPDSASVIATATNAGDCTMTGAVVWADLTHTWVGDLTIQLVHVPTGTTITLLDEPGTGNNSDDLSGLYGFADGYPAFPDLSTGVAVPATIYAPDGLLPLTTFAGQNASGDWELIVSDGAGGDTGTVNAWEVDAVCLDARFHDPGVPEPIFDSTTTTDLIPAYGTCTIRDVSVDMDISHTYIGDLLVSLEHLGTTVTLHNRTGAGLDDIVGNYPGDLAVDGPGALSDFVGLDGIGRWNLSVADNGIGDVGSIDGWSLRIYCQ